MSKLLDLIKKEKDSILGKPEDDMVKHIMSKVDRKIIKRVARSC